MSSENEALIPHNDVKQRSTLRIGLRHLLLVPLILLIYLASEVEHRITNEWIQHTVITQQFPNASFHNKTPPCKDNNETDDMSTEYENAERVISRWILYNKIAEVIPLVFANLILPSYSDTYGRKFVFIISIFGLFVKKALIAACIFFNLHFVVITIAHVIDGITGANVGFLCMAFAYVADLTTDDKNRVLGILVIDVVHILSGLCPAFIAGYMVKSSLGYKFSTITCANLLLVGLIIVIFILPESLPLERRVVRRPILTTIKRNFDFYTSKDFKGQRKFYILLLLIFAVGCNLNGRHTMELLYFLNQPFCWNPISYGHFTLVKQGSRVLFGTVLLRPLQTCLSDEIITVLSVCSVMTSLIIEALATSVLAVYVSTAVNALSFLYAPLIKGLMSTMTARDKQGSLFASLGIIQELSTLLSDLTASLVYQTTLSIMNGFVFLVMAFFAGVQIILLLVYRCQKSGFEKERHQNSVNSKN